MKIALVIFTRNERKNSEKIFPTIPLNLFNKIYVVDGNSTDGTKEFYQKKGIKVFGQKYPGVGGAYHSAFENTKEDALVFFHPDGNSDPVVLSMMVELLRKGSKFVVPSRMIKGAYNEEDYKIFKHRKWFCQLLALVSNVIWGSGKNKCTDVTQGYRAISRDAYNKLGIEVPNAIAPDYEQVIRALKKGIHIKEIATREGHRIHGETSMRSFKTGWENIKVLLKELVS